MFSPELVLFCNTVQYEHFISSGNTLLSDSSFCFLYGDALYSNALDFSGEIKTQHSVNFVVFFRLALTMAGQIVLLGKGMTYD